MWVYEFDKSTLGCTDFNSRIYSFCKYNLSVGIALAQTRRSMISDVPSQSSMNVHPSAGVQLDRIFL